ncbi:hypothetical protein [uncultured Schumannella sp.]|uniref:hypothetical protein n=1 Tax=uncultured Schumannella sp. TaxID=1195956 RepID=UPI0025E7C6B0|nr:hypothetical protein [uncultured Schumannella sp.]
MTDDHQWHAPDAPRDPASSPYHAAPVASGGASGSAPDAPAAPAGANGWAPPPKPGLVPLRPMTLGTILGTSFQVLRRNPKPTLGPALLISLATVLFTLFVTGGVTAWSIGRIESAQSDADADALLAGGVALGVVGIVLAMLLSIIGTAVLQGIIVAEVARATLGEKLTFRGLWAHLRGRVGALIGWAFLLSAALMIALIVVVVVVAGLSLLGEVGIALGVLVAVLAVLGGAVLVAWLSTKFLFVPAALVLERRTLGAAVARSWTLIRGSFWRVFGIVLLVAVMLSIAGQVVTTPVSLLFGLGTTLIAPSGMDEAGFIAITIVSYLVLFVVSAVVGAVTLVVQTATSSLLYLDLRFRTEGLDLELARAVEARQRGEHLTDPYAARPPGSPAFGSPFAS